jgi:hypothetical protein
MDAPQLWGGNFIRRGAAFVFFIGAARFLGGVAIGPPDLLAFAALSIAIFSGVRDPYLYSTNIIQQL